MNNAMNDVGQKTNKKFAQWKAQINLCILTKFQVQFV